VFGAIRKASSWQPFSDPGTYVPYLIGIILAISTAALGRFAAFDRDRVFYPTVLIVTVSYYALFAVLGGSMSALIVESIVVGLFVVAAIAGFKLDLWFVVVALVAHGVFDLVHAYIVTNPGVPVYWPGFCMSYDVALAAILVWSVLRRNSGAVPVPSSLHGIRQILKD
jgi:hypothetical protein